MRTIRRLTAALGAAAALVLALPSESVRAQSALAESGLIGELEGVTIITDPAQWPTSFSEAPSLAEKVAAGELPPVEERLPEDLMVIQPVDGIGQYGGTWRRGFTGPGDNENGNRIQSSDRPILVDHTGAVPRPSLAKGWDDERGRQDLHARSAPRPEMVRRRSLHRRRLRLLVRGHLRQSRTSCRRRSPT